MLIVVWFAFEDSFNGVYVFSSTNFDYFKRWKFSEVHSASPNIAIGTIKIAFLDIFLFHCPPESNVLRIKSEGVEDKDNTVLLPRAYSWVDHAHDTNIAL